MVSGASGTARGLRPSAARAIRRCGRPDLGAALPEGAAILPAQALGELFNVLTRKLLRSREVARTAVLEWADSFEVADSSWPAYQAALDLCTDHGLQVRDALILSVAAENQCRILLSEDLQHGFTWRGVTVVNPFAEPRDTLLVRALQTR